MKKYLLWGAVSQKKLLNPKFRNICISRYLNSGNLAIGHAVQCHLGYSHDELGFIETFIPELVNEKYDALIIPASNFINEKLDIGFRMNLLEKLKIPVVCIGIGAQAASITSDIKINEGMILFLKLISEKSTTIGVRGFYTAELLFKAGIKNVDVIGCPSCFQNMDPDFSLQKKPLTGGFLSAFNFNKKIHSIKLFDMAVDAKSTFFAQTEREEVEISSWGKDDFIRSEIFTKYYSRSKHIPERVYEYLLMHTSIFYDIEKWQQAISAHDFSFGMRFHGNMMALQQKVPALWITHDSRTTELTSFLQLPALDLKDIHKYKGINEFYEITDYSCFNKNYQFLYDNYVRFLEKNGVEHFLSKRRILDTNVII